MRLPIAIAIVASCFTIHCAPSAPSLARTRAASEFQCPAASITTHELSSGTEVVEACGHRAVYSCPRYKWERTCIREAPAVEGGASAAR